MADATDMAQAVQNLFAALGGEDDPDMAALTASFCECSRAYDASSEAFKRGNVKEGKRLAVHAEELRAQHSVLSAAFRHKLSGALSH